MPSAVNKNNNDHDLTNGNKFGSSTKRQNYLEWQEYFMSIAFLSAQRSKDPRTQVGACIVNKDKKIVGIGYNGMPMGCSDDVMPWNRAENETKEKWLQSKSPYVCHAELNAVLNKNLADVSGCSIYVALFPCNMCAQIIIQSGIEEVIYYSDKYHNQPEFVASRFLMDTSGVKYRQFRPRQKKIIIDFELIESTAGAVPTLPSLPITNASGNEEQQKTDLRKRINSSSQPNKIDENNCFTDKDVAVRKIQADESESDLTYNNIVPHQVDSDFNVDESPDFEAHEELCVDDEEKKGVERRFALISLFFLSSLVLFIWHLSASLDNHISVANIQPSSTSVSWTQVAENPLF